MFIGALCEYRIEKFRTREDRLAARAVLVKLGVSYFDISINSLNDSLVFYAHSPDSDTLGQKLNVLSWFLEYDLEGNCTSRDIDQRYKLAANSHTFAEPNSIGLSIREDSPARSTAIMITQPYQPVEELLSSSKDSDRALGLLIVSLELEQLKEKLSRYLSAQQTPFSV